MSNTTTTPYMSLSLPIVGTEVGPAWASEVNQAFTTVDSHNHTSGQGVPIPSAGININADLGFNGYNAYGFRTVRLGSQSAALSLASDLLCLYATGGNLYYNDGSGNQIQITAAGVVNTSSSGNISGMGGTSAAATYTNATSTFAFTSATNTPAKMSFGPIAIGRNAVSPYTVTLIANASATGSFTLTFPTALPASTGFMQMDTSGNITVGGVVVPGTSNGLVSLNGLTGRTSASAIGAGYVGESSNSSGTSNTALVNSAYVTGDTLTLTAGTWLLFGQANQISITANSGGRIFFGLASNSGAYTDLVQVSFFKTDGSTSADSAGVSTFTHLVNFSNADSSAVRTVAVRAQVALGSSITGTFSSFINAYRIA